MELGIYPSAFYRVTVKGIIRNEQNEVLLVKEASDNWSLPGGGIDHGETLEQALAREMYEEACITQVPTARVIGTESFFVGEKSAYCMWIVCELEFEDAVVFKVGKDAWAARFIDPRVLKASRARSERLVYRWCVDRSAAFE